MKIMYDPVLDNEGNSYERSTLLKWLKEHQNSPISGQPLNEKMVTSNNALREAIYEYMGSEWLAHRKQEIEAIDKEASTGRSKLCSSNFRAKMDCFLRNTSRNLCGINLNLNQEDGLCAFKYGGIPFSLDVPSEAGVFCLYTREMVQESDVPECMRETVFERALELNFLQADTRGGCVSLRTSQSENEPWEMMFSYTDRVSEVTADDFSNILLNFVETAVLVRDRLMATVPRKESCQQQQQVGKCMRSQKDSGNTTPYPGLSRNIKQDQEIK
jgi:hypothetical protein